MIKNRDIEFLEGWELSSIIGCPLTKEIKEALQMFGIGYDRFRQGFKVNISRIERVETERVAARNT